LATWASPSEEKRLVGSDNGFLGTAVMESGARNTVLRPSAKFRTMGSPSGVQEASMLKLMDSHSKHAMSMST
ncbi:hypothetical protein L218DRAFT_956210, partial [Marasmius fiardii PR-910]